MLTFPWPLHGRIHARGNSLPDLHALRRSAVASAHSDTAGPRSALDPAFVVDVYSTQTDFAQGIVRIDIAVRPVRAIDYIYATIRVKN